MSDTNFWQAVLRRDARYDRVFVYAVRSTGIYCRPSCPSRRPRQDRVAFNADAAAAEQAGFRPCRRCRPQADAPADPWLDRVRRACVALKNGEDRLSLDEIAAAVGGSRFQLHRRFRQMLGITPHEFADACRLDRLKTRLRAGGTITAALYDSGFGSTRALYEKSTSRLGMTPRFYQRVGASLTIVYSIGSSSLGRVLVARTAKGVCSIKLGEDDDGLTAELRTEFPGADLRDGGPSGDPTLQAVLRRIDGKPPHVDLPLDIRGTAFLRRVWAELMAIPAGETRSYSAIAATIGQPGAARAVGSACAANSIAVLIPCHRAVREDGSLGGYRWGHRRKQDLIDRERKEAVSSKPRKQR